MLRVDLAQQVSVGLKDPRDNEVHLAVRVQLDQQAPSGHLGLMELSVQKVHWVHQALGVPLDFQVLLGLMVPKAALDLLESKVKGEIWDKSATKENLEPKASRVHLVHRELLVQWVKKAREDSAVTLVQLVLLGQLEKEVPQVIVVFQVKMGYLVQRVHKDSVVSQVLQALRDRLVILAALVIVVSQEQGV